MSTYNIIDQKVIKTLGEIKVEYDDVYFFEKLTIGYEDYILEWFKKNWTLSFLFSSIYVIVIFSIKQYMSSRSRLEIRLPMIAWSGALAIFSIFGAARSIPELVYVFHHYSFHHTVCHPSIYYGASGFWTVVFTFSKTWELGDTIFIVLRKQPLIFLHWYHHITVMIYCWMVYMEHLAPGRWFLVNNYIVHSFMYTYYTARALRFQTPKWVAMGITSLQLIQMVVGTAIHIYSYVVIHYWGAIHCQAQSSTLHWGLAMYLSYFVLFVNFFYQTYIKKWSSDRSGRAANNAPLDKKSD